MTSKITQVQELTEVDRGGPDSITLRAHIDETFTIGPKVHGGTLQMVVAKAARTALTALTPDGDRLAESAAAMIPVAISSDYLTAPDAADVDLVISVRKRGRTVTVLSVDAVQLGRTVVSSSVTMARRRPASRSTVRPSPRSTTSAPPSTWSSTRRRSPSSAARPASRSSVGGFGRRASNPTSTSRSWSVTSRPRSS